MSEIYRGHQRQIALEAEGADAGLAGKVRADCPYDEKTQSFEWNHWVYGCERATAPTMIALDGCTIWATTSANWKPPADYLLKYPDGRITTKDGKPAEVKP